MRLGPTVLAYFGEIHPGLLLACDAAGADGRIRNLLCQYSSKPLKRHRQAASLKLEPLQPVARDFAFVVGQEVSVAKLIQAIKGADKNLIRDVAVFDVYEGDKVGADKKSVALSVTLQPTDKTLTDAEIEAISYPHHGRRYESERRGAGVKLPTELAIHSRGDSASAPLRVIWVLACWAFMILLQQINASCAPPGAFKTFQTRGAAPGISDDLNAELTGCSRRICVSEGPRA